MFKTEEQLRRSFVLNAQPSLWTRWTPSAVRTAEESKCSDGRADWVWSRYDIAPATISNIELLQHPTCSRILASLKFQSPRQLEFLASKCGVARATFKRYLQQLIDADLVHEVKSNRFILNSVLNVSPAEICAFEFKLYNWRRALYQAKRYRAFAHRVYVVTPPDVAVRMHASIEVFRRFNIGILSHSADGTSQRLLSSDKRRPLSPTSFIQANGMLLR